MSGSSSSHMPGSLHLKQLSQVSCCVRSCLIRCSGAQCQAPMTPSPHPGMPILRYPPVNGARAGVAVLATPNNADQPSFTNTNSSIFNDHRNDCGTSPVARPTPFQSPRRMRPRILLTLLCAIQKLNLGAVRSLIMHLTGSLGTAYVPSRMIEVHVSSITVNNY